MATILTAVDTIHAYVNNIPADSSAIQQVNGYITERNPGDGIKWTEQDWARFPNYVKKRIAQLPQNDPAADILDVEPGGATDPTAVAWVKARHDAKQAAHIYVDSANVQSLDDALKAADELSQTYLWLADWNLNETEATALLGTDYGGLRVEMVQWASPSSNPNTILPGTNYTLKNAGCDLSVAIPFSTWKEPVKAISLVSVMAVATYSDGSKKSWSVS